MTKYKEIGKFLKSFSQKELKVMESASSEDLLKAMDYELKNGKGLDEEEVVVLKVIRELASKGAKGKDILKFIDAFVDILREPREKAERTFINRCILSEVPNPENYDFSYISRKPEREVILVYDRKIPVSARRNLQEMFVEELKPKEEKMGKSIYFILRRQTGSFIDEDFVGGSRIYQIFESLEPYKIDIINVNATELTRLKDDEKRYIIRHEIAENILKTNDVPKYCEVRWFKESENKLNWYEEVRNVVIDTSLLLENPKESAPTFRYLRRKLLEEYVFMRRVKFTPKGIETRANVVASLILGLQSTRVTTPFKIASERVSDGYKGAFNSYYAQLDSIAIRKENYTSPLGTRFRRMLEDELYDFKVVDDKIDDGFCQHMYKVIDDFVNNL